MIEIADLKKINMLKSLDDKKLELMSDTASLESRRKGSFFFHDGSEADRIYGLLSGRVGLAVAKHPEHHTWLVEIGPSNSFGISAAIFVPGAKYMYCAKALSGVKALSWKGDELRDLFEEDFELGYRIMSEMARMVKDRLTVVNIQFVDIYS
ncbi:MAG: cyclic nucleotide-binding domain-containing protein [Desulfobacterales bacterium]